jgi:hypothetical protein
LHKRRGATIYGGTVPKGWPSEAVTISSPERRMYAHFLDRDRFLLVPEAPAPCRRICGRRETDLGSGQVIEAENPRPNPRRMVESGCVAIIPRMTEGKAQRERRRRKPLCSAGTSWQRFLQPQRAE